MEIFIEIIFGMILADLIIRGVLFSKREEKWYKTLIPGYNRYTIGKLCDSKKTGLVASISNAAFLLVFIVYFGLEVYLFNSDQLVVIDNELYGYATSGVLATFMNYILPYAWYAFALISWLSWIRLTRNFSIKQESSSWWMFVWAICPIISYIYFGCIKNRMYIPEKGLVDRKIEYKKAT